MADGVAIRVAITGAAGLLGSECVKASQTRGWTVLPITRNEWDMSYPDTIEPVLKKLNPSVVIHCAAETNVDRCETEPRHAFLVNAEATGVLARAAVAINARLVYISSCGIFATDQRRPNTEMTPVAPCTSYAASKLEGERLVLASHSTALICRVGWLFGGASSQRKNFVEARRKEAASSPVIRSAIDKWGTPTWAWHASQRILELTIQSASGIVHVANQGVASRYEYVSEIVRLFGYKTPVIPVTSAEFRRIAPVPDYEGLVSCRLEEFSLPPLPSWKLALETYVRELCTASS